MSGATPVCDDTFLDETWALHFHDPDNNEWTKDSYKMLTVISTPEDWAKTDQAFRELWQKGMFFVMREYIAPLWEDPANTNGGCFSFKVNKPQVTDYWYDIVARMLGNTLGKSDDISDKICGLSISPKRNYCIIRLWIGANDYNDISHYNIEVPDYTQVMYKEHMANCDFNM